MTNNELLKIIDDLLRPHKKDIEQDELLINEYTKFSEVQKISSNSILKIGKNFSDFSDFKSELEKKVNVYFKKNINDIKAKAAAAAETAAAAEAVAEAEAAAVEAAAASVRLDLRDTDEARGV